eukprot:2124604-Ditylum_brightwellii.AAC.1
MSFKTNKAEVREGRNQFGEGPKVLDDTTETMVELCDATKIDEGNGLSLPLLKGIVETCCDTAEGAAP